MAFYSQTNGQTERQNRIMKAYLLVFVNYEQNDQARLLLIAKFAHNNIKNASTGSMSFELNCGYYPYMSNKDNIVSYSKFKSADKLLTEL